MNQSIDSYNLIYQHYPPGTHEDDNSFSSRNLILGKGKELEFPEGQGGGKGEPPVPPILHHLQQQVLLSWIYFLVSFQDLLLFFSECV